MSKTNLHLGVISDTHGLLRPEAVAALRGCDLIVHAGDVGNVAVLDGLRHIAPTFAIRGNIDTASWAARLPPTEIVEIGELSLYVLHNIADLDLDPPTAGFAAVVYGTRISRRSKRATGFSISIPAPPDRAGSGCRLRSRVSR
ncbi:MAG TPA: metallophosphoesterase family protein [Xanthobacteraceae bacterium]|nr:metallophosphoesterase family protein [Xanthobacteraceae bacterium]